MPAAGQLTRLKYVWKTVGLYVPWTQLLNRYGSQSLGSECQSVASSKNIPREATVVESYELLFTLHR
jgi:hypothetical protein